MTKYTFRQYSLFVPAGRHWRIRNAFQFKNPSLVGIGRAQICGRSIATSGKTDVRILEVGPRDGLQNIKQTVETPVKIELIRRLAAAGLKHIEATSFVSPKWIPQLADCRKVLNEVLPLSQIEDPVNLPVLVPNMKGLEGAIESKARAIVVFGSASEGFSQRNTNCSVEEGLAKAKEVTRNAKARGMAVRGVVSCIFACPYDGPTEPTKVLSVVKSFLEMGCYEVGLGDTLGVGTPADVERLLEVLLAEISPDKLAGHFHDTYGQAVANVIKAYELGLTSFDSSVAGLGGCPYAQGAKGNLATEDIAYTFEKFGVKTGVELDKLVDIGQWISAHLGIPNGSRAGSALFAKKTAKLQNRHYQGTQKHEQGRQWRQLEDTGEYNVSQSGNAIKITLTRSKNGNALTNSMVLGLTELFVKISHDPSIFHVFLAADGRYFCTGMDLSSSGSSSNNDPNVKADYYSKVVRLFSAIDSAPQTTVAVVEGPCYGGGNALAFVCDIRLVSKDAKFTMTEITLGLSPAIISKYMVREWGVAFCREAILTGRSVSAPELHRIGAVHGLANDNYSLQNMMDDYANMLMKCAPRTATKCKELVKLGWKDPDGESQESKIKQTFDDMMAPGSEGDHGMERFRAKVKGIDWGKFWSERARL